MVEQKIRIGIIGCGLIADVHVEAILAALSNAEVSVCDPLYGKAELLRRKYGLFKSYVSIEDMLRHEKPFSVHVCTPPQYHVQHAITCLEAGCHVLVEKPFSLRVEEAVDAYEVAQRVNRTLCVNHSILFQPCVSKMLEKIGLWGEAAVTNVTSYFGIDTAMLKTAAMPEQHWKRQLPGGTAVDTIIHPITLAVKLTGAPTSIAVIYSGSPRQPDELQVMWKGAVGIASVMASTRGCPFRRTTEVTTDKGSILIDHSTEIAIPMDSGIGPKAARKIQRNMILGLGMITGTIRSTWQVARRKLKDNPGVRFHVAAYYRQLSSSGPVLVSKEDVIHATQVLSKINEELLKAIPGRDQPGVMNEASVKEGESRTLAGKVFLTGASGLLGSTLCECLSNSGRLVRAQVRRSRNADMLRSKNVERLYVDFSNGPINYEEVIGGAEEIIHCAHSAGAVTWEQFKSVNVDTSVALYKAARTSGCRKFVYISSVAVYGVHNRYPNVVNEATPAILGQSRYDFYVRSKTIAEQELIRLAKEGGPSLLIVRPGILYAADGRRLLKKAIPLRDGRLVLAFGAGRNHLPYTRVDAVARTICAALDKIPFSTGIYQLAGDSNETSREFLVNRARKLGISCQFLTIPAAPVRWLAWTMEMAHLVAFRKRPPKLTRYLLDSSTRDLRYDCSKAEKDLGWNRAEATSL
jgi:predicted dehydrogenase/nucleoside-diphosphate-sugar epimerase